MNYPQSSWANIASSFVDSSLLPQQIANNLRSTATSGWMQTLSSLTGKPIAGNTSTSTASGWNNTLNAVLTGQYSEQGTWGQVLGRYLPQF